MAKPARIAAIPRALIGALALIALAERTIARHELALTTNPTSLAWRTAGRSASVEATRAEVLCFGDSLVKLGVVPRLIEARTGRTAYNLAIEASSPPAAFVLLKRALDAGARPRAILVDYHSQVLPVPPHFALDYWPELLGIREAADLGWANRDAGFVARTVVRGLVPSLKLRDGCREAFRSALNGEAGDRGAVRFAAHLRNWRRNGGATVHHKHATPPEPVSEPRRRGNWTPLKSNLRYIRRFLDLAAPRDIPVYWLMPPLTPARQRNLELQGIEERFTRVVRAIQDDYPNLHVIDGLHAAYPQDVFIDATHLDRDGASEFTSTVAGLIGTNPTTSDAGGRWLRLPPYTGRTSDVPLEDIRQSELASAASDIALRR